MSNVPTRADIVWYPELIEQIAERWNTQTAPGVVTTVYRLKPSVNQIYLHDLDQWITVGERLDGLYNQVCLIQHQNVSNVSVAGLSRFTRVKYPDSVDDSWLLYLGWPTAICARGMFVFDDAIEAWLGEGQLRTAAPLPVRGGRAIIEAS